VRRGFDAADRTADNHHDNVDNVDNLDDLDLQFDNVDNLNDLDLQFDHPNVDNLDDLDLQFDHPNDDDAADDLRVDYRAGIRLNRASGRDQHLVARYHTAGQHHDRSWIGDDAAAFHGRAAYGGPATRSALAC
jgi:hypothetical protein